MILTVTPNPSIDRTVHVGRLVRGSVLRSSRTAVHPSGKGVNVARCLTANGVAARAVVPLGGQEGEQFARMLAGEGIDFMPVPIRGTVRVNISVREADGTVTKINESGPALSEDEVAALFEATVAAAADANWLVASGSLPRGAAGFYVRLARWARRAGLPFAVDTRGDLLGPVAACGVGLIKPNLPELAAATGRRPATLGEAARAAEGLAAAGGCSVVASLGPDGALLVQDGRVWHGEAGVETVRSAVGAGDALLAGFLAGGARGPEALRTALAWAAAACRLDDSRVPSGDDITDEGVQLYARVDEARRLTRRPVATANTSGGEGS